MKIEPLPMTPTSAPVRPKLDHLVYVANAWQRDEIKDWIIHHVVGDYKVDYVRVEPYVAKFVNGQMRYPDYRFAYRFELEDDAFRFKLWWG